MFNPESKYIEALDITKAYIEARKMLQKDAIQLKPFKNIYGHDDVERDEAYVKAMEEKFKEQNAPEQAETEKLATIFEAIVHEHAELSEWFGSNASTVKTSRYDDIKNGIDDIVEFNEEEGTTHLGLAIDVTFSPEKDQAFERIRKEIQRGELAHIKYFKPDPQSTDLPKLPHVIIGADAKTVRNLSDLWLEKKNRELGKHPIQFQVLEEILLQLDAYESYANSVHQEELALIYKRTRAIIEKIYAEKQKTLEDSGERDFVFESIKNNLQIFS